MKTIIFMILLSITLLGQTETKPVDPYLYSDADSGWISLNEYMTTSLNQPTTTTNHIKTFNSHSIKKIEWAAEAWFKKNPSIEIIKITHRTHKGAYAEKDFNGYPIDVHSVVIFYKKFSYGSK